MTGIAKVVLGATLLPVAGLIGRSIGKHVKKKEMENEEVKAEIIHDLKWTDIDYFDLREKYYYVPSHIWNSACEEYGIDKLNERIINAELQK